MVLFDAMIFPSAKGLLSFAPDSSPDELDESIAPLLVGKGAGTPVIEYAPELPFIVVVEAVAEVVGNHPSVAGSCLLYLFLLVPFHQEFQQEVVLGLKLGDLFVIVDSIEGFKSFYKPSLDIFLLPSLPVIVADVSESQDTCDLPILALLFVENVLKEASLVE